MRQRGLRLTLADHQRLNGGYMQQAAPNRDFRRFAADIRDGNIQTAAHEQGHFGVPDVVPLAVGEANSKWLEGPSLQLLFENCVTHLASAQVDETDSFESTLIMPQSKM
jgi:hypothetical protein